MMESPQMALRKPFDETVLDHIPFKIEILIIIEMLIFYQIRTSENSGLCRFHLSVPSDGSHNSPSRVMHILGLTSSLEGFNNQQNPIKT